MRTFKMSVFTCGWGGVHRDQLIEVKKKEKTVIV